MTQQEQGEEHSFLDAVMQTRPMQYVHSYLAQKVARSAWRCFMHLYSVCKMPLLAGHHLTDNFLADVMQNLVAGSPEVFKQQLHQMWFSFYSRSNVRDDTCGFEHGASMAHACRALSQSTDASIFPSRCGHTRQSALGRVPTPNAPASIQIHKLHSCRRHLRSASLLYKANAGFLCMGCSATCSSAVPALHSSSSVLFASGWLYGLNRLEVRVRGAHRALCDRERED